MLTKVYYGWWVVVASFAIAFCVGGVVYYSPTAFFKPIIEEHGWSYAQASIAFSMRGLEMGLLAPLIGVLVDRFGSRKLLLFGFFMISLGLVLISITKSLGMLYCGFLILGIGSGGCTSVVLMTAVASWFKKNLGKALGIAASGFGAGGTILPLLVFLIDAFSWRTALIILAFGILMFGVPLAFIISDNPEPNGCHIDEELPVNRSLCHEYKEKEATITFRSIIKSNNFWLVCLAEAVQWLIVSSVILHIMPYLASIGMQKRSASLVVMVMTLLSIVGRIGFGWLGDMIDKRYAMAGAYCLTGLGVLPFSYAQIGWTTLPFLLFFGPAYAGTIGLKAAMLKEYFGGVSLGKALGIVLGISALAGVAGPALAGWTFDNMGNYHLIWLMFCGLASIPIAAILLAARPQPGYLHC